MKLLLAPLLLATATPAPAQAEQVDIELLRPDGKSFAVHHIDRPSGDEHIVIPDGTTAWSITVARNLYQDRLELCTTLSRWASDGDRIGLAETCVVLQGRESPEATTTTKTDDVHLRLTVRK